MKNYFQQFHELSQFKLLMIKKSMLNAIVTATFQASFLIKAKLIIVFSTTGATALKLCKLRTICPVLSVTSD
jgi:pyruvate kinase